MQHLTYGEYYYCTTSNSNIVKYALAKCTAILTNYNATCELLIVN